MYESRWPHVLFLTGHFCLCECSMFCLLDLSLLTRWVTWMVCGLCLLVSFFFSVYFLKSSASLPTWPPNPVALSTAAGACPASACLLCRLFFPSWVCSWVLAGIKWDTVAGKRMGSRKHSRRPAMLQWGKSGWMGEGQGWPRKGGGGWTSRGQTSQREE